MRDYLLELVRERCLGDSPIKEPEPADYGLRILSSDGFGSLLLAGPVPGAHVSTAGSPVNFRVHLGAEATMAAHADLLRRYHEYLRARLRLQLFQKCALAVLVQHEPAARREGLLLGRGGVRRIMNFARAHPGVAREVAVLQEWEGRAVTSMRALERAGGTLGLLRQCASLVPRRHRDEILLDLSDDISEFRSFGWPEARIRVHVLYQLVIVALPRLTTLGAGLAAVGFLAWRVARLLHS